MLEDHWSLNTANFSFEIEGQEVGRFAEVSGLSVTVEVKDIDEGGDNESAQWVGGRLKWPNLKLKRGLTRSDVLWKWLKRTSGNLYDGEKLETYDATLKLLAADGRVMRKWVFRDVLPVKWTGPSFVVDKDDIATEELEFVHHGFEPA